MGSFVLHEGKPVIVDGKKLYEVKYETPLLMKLLAGPDREKYGEYKVVEVNWKDWDGDIRKLSPSAGEGLARTLASGSRTPVGGGSGTPSCSPARGNTAAAVKKEFWEQITAESEDTQRDWGSPRPFVPGSFYVDG